MLAQQTLSVEGLFEEFERTYTLPSRIPEDIEAIIVLTADNLPTGTGPAENCSRVSHAIELFHALRRKVPVFFSGVTEEEAEAVRLMRELPAGYACFQDCGKRGEANTLTQFRAINSDPRMKDLKSLVFVTDTYHIPRVLRTAGKNLPEDVRFVVSSDRENDWKLNNTFLRVAGEISRIIRYAEKGDILAFPR